MNNKFEATEDQIKELRKIAEKMIDSDINIFFVLKAEDMAQTNEEIFNMMRYWIENYNRSKAIISYIKTTMELESNAKSDGS